MPIEDWKQAGNARLTAMVERAQRATEQYDVDEPRTGYTIATLAVLIGWLLLALPWLSGAYTIPWDAKAHFLPQAQFLAQSIREGQSPFWLPYAFSGHPQIADPQSLVFSPPFLLLALFNGSPGATAVDATVLAMALLGALAVVVFFRDRDWHPIGAILAALAFAFGASMAWRVQHTTQVISVVMFMITLVLLSRAIERRSTGYGIAAGVMGGLLLIGRDQVALLGVYLLAGYLFWAWATAPDRRELFYAMRRPLCGGGLAALAIAAIPIGLTLMLAQVSNRPEIDYTGAGRGSLHPALLLTFLSPDLFGAAGRMEDYWGPPSFAWNDTGLFIAQNMGVLYIGVIPALLFLYGLFSGTLWRREVRYVTLAFAAMLLFALGWYTPFFRLAYWLLPGVSFFRRPADATFLVGALAGILAGYTLSDLLKQTKEGGHAWRITAVVVTLAVSLVLAIFLSLRLGHFSDATWPVFVTIVLTLMGGALLMFGLRLLSGVPVLLGGLLTLFTIADLAVNNGYNSSNALPRQAYDILEPQTRNETIRLLKARVSENTTSTMRPRVELVGLGFHTPNASLTHKLENTLGYNPVRLATYTRATGAEDTVGLAEQRKFAPLFPSYRSGLADMLGLTYIASSVPIETLDRSLNAGDLDLVARTGEAYVYENPRALPRVLLATSTRQADFEEILKSGRWPAFNPRSTVLLERLPAEPARQLRPGQAWISTYGTTRIDVEVESPDGGILLLNDIWHPWWSATVGRAPAEVLRANVLFRAVSVPPGRQTVSFRFRPIRGAVAQFMQRAIDKAQPRGTLTPVARAAR